MIRLDGYRPYCEAQGFGRPDGPGSFRSIRAVELPNGVTAVRYRTYSRRRRLQSLDATLLRPRFFDPGLSLDRLGVYDIPRLSAEFLLKDRAGALNFHCGYRNKDFLITSLPRTYILDRSSILEGIPIRSYDMHPTANNYLHFCEQEGLQPETWSSNYDITVLLRIIEQGYPTKGIPKIWEQKAGSLRDFSDIVARLNPQNPDHSIEQNVRQKAKTLLENRYPDRRKAPADNTVQQMSFRTEHCFDTSSPHPSKRHSI